MQSFVEHLLRHPGIGGKVVHRQALPGAPASFGEPEEPLTPDVREALRNQGVERLYTHQARGLDILRQGHNLLQVTPTASGKTLLFAASVLESLQQDPESKALFLYPTKALAQDQLAAFRSLAGGMGALNPPRFEIYDGDTPAARRRKIKADPPQVLISNPDMLHMGILAHHADWAPFLGHLRWIVLDELHVYRGIFGSHVHHILARLQRLCSRLGASPRFIAASATVGNPQEFAATLVGRPFEVVSESGAPSAPREVVFLNPAGVSPYTVALRVVIETIRAGFRGIAFTKARRVTELLYAWLLRQAPELEHRVAPYRAGYLPEERRRLEARLFRGELSAVLCTSALELGIDVGGLDVCVLVGYPGSLISSWQRIGRIGRKGQAGLVVLIALPDALDQYVVHHPELFFGQEFERAVLYPANPLVAGRHLVCAAAEEPLNREEIESPQSLVDELVRDGRLVQDADGRRFYAFQRRPHRFVNPRSSGEPFAIVEYGTGRSLGSIDGRRVYHECHAGAVYLHGGQSFRIRELDTERRRVVAESARTDYYTVVSGDKETEILERLESRRLGPLHVGLGRLKVTVWIREYQKKRLFDGETFATHPLEVPPLIFETVGFWIELPPDLPSAYAQRDLHFMGGIHATEHATIGLFPLLTIADRDDIGGISYTGHPQTGAPAIFVYDGVPGGAGLARQGYGEIERLLERTFELVRDCPCESGCPGCIQSPKCGNGNKPLDKEAALLTLRLLTGRETLEALDVEAAPDATLTLRPFVSRVDPDAPRRHGISRAGNVDPLGPHPPRGSSPDRASATAVPRANPGGAKAGASAGSAVPGKALAPQAGHEHRAAARSGRHGPLAGEVAPRRASGRTLVFDLETQLSAAEVGGWANMDRMRLSLAVVFDTERRAYRTYYEADVDRLLLDLVMADCVIGFNVDRFDLSVLSAYTEWNLERIRTLDLLTDIHRQLGFRLSLAHLSEVNLGESKGGDGLQSLRWWKEGRIDLIEQYCKKDVDLTHQLYELGRGRGFLLYRDHADRTVRLPVAW